MVHKQGDLDNLCGLYAIINALALVLGSKLNENRQAKLFRRICDWLEEQDELAAGIRYGQTGPFLEQVLRRATKLVQQETDIRIGITRPFQQNTVSVSAFWQRLIDQQEDAGPGSIILRIRQPMDHWTCARRITSDAILLADSYRFSKLDKKTCVTRGSPPRDGHLVSPKQTLFLRRLHD